MRRCGGGADLSSVAPGRPSAEADILPPIGALDRRIQWHQSNTPLAHLGRIGERPNDAIATKPARRHQTANSVERTHVTIYVKGPERKQPPGTTIVCVHHCRRAQSG